MNAVLIELDVGDVDEKRGLDALRDRIVPTIRSMSGFRSGVWLTGNEAGKGLSLTVWDTPADAQAMADRFGVRSSPQAGAAVERCEVREVAASVTS
jgi:hypothetical protein